LSTEALQVVLLQKPIDPGLDSARTTSWWLVIDAGYTKGGVHIVERIGQIASI